MARLSIGVMGGAAAVLDSPEIPRLKGLADQLGIAIARQGAVLVTGATSGIPYMVSRAARAAGGLTVGISPAATGLEHVERYNLPLDGSEVIIYTGFGLKGRNVINIRSSDIVIIFGGCVGTLNEFTIAYDEGRIIGVLTGTGGVADHIDDVVKFCRKPTSSVLIFDPDPENLVRECVKRMPELH
jgi:uncharacterized protein (TIGR00725 family)